MASSADGATDPFAELADERRDDLEQLADSDLPAAWVARAILNATDEDGDGDGE